MSEKKFDKEYSTSYIREKKFLDACGIKYAFVKVIDEITIYKYVKTPRLFDCLRVFYEQFHDNGKKADDMEGIKNGAES